MAFIVLPLAACQRGDNDPIQTNRRTVTLHVEVTDAAGQTRVGDISCVGDVKATGFLDGAGGDNACVTVFVGPMAIKVLRAMRDDNKLPCDQMIEAWQKSGETITSEGTARITGTYERKPINVTLERTTKPCDEAAWGILEPLFTPLPKPRTIPEPE